MKAADDMAPAARRLAAARALARHPRIVVTGLEEGLGTRYTADTLAALRRRFPRTRFVWLMGADNLVEIPRWDRWTQIFRAVPIAIFARPPYSLRALTGKAASRFARHRHAGTGAGGLVDRRPPAWAFFHTPLNPASATALRERRADRTGRREGPLPSR
jgi:nicotinate-nucleotide adenylyltransferase